MSDATPQKAYQVLARKYRPQTFEDMIGQEAMVTTLTNAFKADRVAHAFMMTGVRGIGKTTTARLLARALNYQSDNVEGPSTDFSQMGHHCERIMASTHMDVLEMDAASRTGVENMRELLDGVRYAPVEARYKVYIIDEVHMLSTGAFNALLKTLEEPPDHAKFIFATTEIRKVPITVLSRCQRFDLRRVEANVLADHLKKICAQESVSVSDDGLALISRAAEGSVRDSLSLLDQALVQSAGDDGEISAPQIRHMLGLGDRSRVFDLFDHAARGRAQDGLAELGSQYRDGADPVIIMRDLLDMCHEISRAKAMGGDADFDAAPDQIARMQALAGDLTQGQLSRLWQILTADYSAVRLAPVPLASAEMSIIKLASAAEMPPPELVASILSEIKSGNFNHPGLKISNGSGVNRISRSSSSSVSAPKTAQKPAPKSDQTASLSSRVAPVQKGEPETLPPPPPAPTADIYSAPPDAVVVSESAAVQNFADFEALVEALPREKIGIKSDIDRYFRVLSYRAGHLRISKPKAAPPSLIGRAVEAFTDLTGELWVIDITDEAGGETLKEKRVRETKEREAKDRAHPAFNHSLLKRARLIEIREVVPTSSGVMPIRGNEG